MATSLIVARMNPDSADQVAEIFAESDGTRLPGLVGVTRRKLFRYQGLYFHLFVSGETGSEQVDRVRDHDLFQDINTRLAEHIAPYDPATWRGPKDAMAELFYEWSQCSNKV